VCECVGAQGWGGAPGGLDIGRGSAQVLIQSLYNPSGSVRVCLVYEKTRLFTRRGPPSGCVRLTDPAFAQTGSRAGTALGTTTSVARLRRSGQALVQNFAADGGSANGLQVRAHRDGRPQLTIRLPHQVCQGSVRVRQGLSRTRLFTRRTTSEALAVAGTFCRSFLLTHVEVL